MKPITRSLLILLQKTFKSGANQDFTLLFLNKEGKTLLGKRYSNFIFLFLILFITFLAIGIANGSLHYLEKKMNDPFINWVSVDIPFGRADSVPSYIKQLTLDTVERERLEYANIKAFTFCYLSFYDKKGTSHYSRRGRTIEADDPLLTEIFNRPGNLLKGRQFKSNDELGLIVTAKLLIKLNYNPNSTVLFINHAIGDPTNNEKDIPVPLPILAVVKDLPGLTDFFVTPNFHIQRYETPGENPFNPAFTNHIELLTFTKSDANKLEKAVSGFFKNNLTFQQYDPRPWQDTNARAYETAYVVKIGLKPDTSYALRKNIFSALSQEKEVRKINFIHYYDFYTSTSAFDTNVLKSYDRMSIKMLKLAKVNALGGHLLKKFNLRLDMAQVQTVENYSFISNLTNIISLTLIVFSILSICLFISSLLKNHLERMKMNIGTFKAFGLDNKALAQIYVAIIFMFIFSAMALAILLSWIYGNLGGVRFLFFLTGREVEANENYFELVKPWSDHSLIGWSAFSVIFIFLTSYVVLKYITGKIFSKTPGDLIYDR
jgi:hypothetical protein